MSKLYSSGFIFILLSLYIRGTNGGVDEKEEFAEEIDVGWTLTNAYLVFCMIFNLKELT